MQGSSPRLRGTRISLLGFYPHRGIIPALAGNTSLSTWLRASGGDHPRACGEHQNLSCAHLLGLGSSPRLRGTLTSPWRVSPTIGIIPALAGNTHTAIRKHGRCWDHPRACGEHLPENIGATKPEGSSPRLRGTPRDLAVESSQQGIIPALAGNTPMPGRPGHSWWDHPRACGEHSSSVWMSCRCSGSSPRLRGTHVNGRVTPVIPGIIPALAGNTLRLIRSPMRCWDHPRACGEHGNIMIRTTNGPGSSPRLRGTLHCFGVIVVHIGIIPALAGNTTQPARRRCSTWDHPRACGEH